MEAAEAKPRAFHTIVVFTFFFLTTVGAYCLWTQYKRLSQFKGPFSTGVSWLWHRWAVISGRSHLYYGEVTQKYGPIARVAPNLLVTSSPELWAKINAARSPYPRSAWYYQQARFEDGKDNVFTECDSEKHDARRKKMAAGYSGKENPRLETTIDDQIKSLIHLIRTKYASPAACTTPRKPMNLASKIEYLTLDVISAVGLGEAFGHLKTDSDVNGYCASCHTGLYIANASFALGTSWLLKVPVLGPFLAPSENDVSGFGRMMATARQAITARKAKGTDDRSDMLSAFIRHGLSAEDVFQETFEAILAGSDTTSAAIRMILLYIMSHPRVYRKLQTEIDDAVKNGLAPSSPEIISDANARQLPYLCAVIREGLRIHPPVANLFPHVVPPKGDTITLEDGSSQFLPGGTLIGYSAWTMHRNNTDVYGPDADVFRPERWLLPSDDPTLARMRQVNDLIFGYGRWQCLGKNVGMIEIHKTIFELLRTFDWGINRPERPWWLFNNMGLFGIKDFWVDVSLRE